MQSLQRSLVLVTVAGIHAATARVLRNTPTNRQLSTTVVAAPLQPESAALLCGLTEHSDYNGRRVRVVHFNESSRRYTVRAEAAPGGREGSGRASIGMAYLVSLPSNGTMAGEMSHCAGSLVASVNGTHIMAESANVRVHPVVDNDIFHSKCAQACDACFLTHLQACEAKCHEGCQAYCIKQTVHLPGCATEGYWTAQTAGPAGSRQCTWDNGPNACNKWRNCESKQEDSCPEWYLY